MIRVVADLVDSAGSLDVAYLTVEEGVVFNSEVAAAVDGGRWGDDRGT